MGESERIRVLIADDHPLVRLGLETLLGTQPDMEVVGLARDGEEAVRLALATRPDVVVLDAYMPRQDGLAALPEIRRAAPGTRCVVLSGFGDLATVAQALKLGAEGFVQKMAGMEELLRAIRAIHHGQSALDPQVTGQLIKAYQERQDAVQGTGHLTPAEVEVLRLLARGLSNRALAAELGVSVRTVTTHIQHILGKLGLANRLQAALYAREHGLGDGASERSTPA